MTTKARRGTAKTPDRAVALVRSVHGELTHRSGMAIPLRLWDGSELGDPQAGFRLVLEHPWSLRLLLRLPFDLAAGEAYTQGAIDLEGDVVAAMALGARLDEHGVFSVGELARLFRALPRVPRPPRHRGPRRAALHGRMHTKRRDAGAIAFHYDLPGEFYEAFLGALPVYSCAYWHDPTEPLEAAQTRKLDVVCRKLRLRPGMRLLDIGCGWGALLLHAAREYGVHGVGVTLSRTQAEAGRAWVAREGLTDRLEIRLQDYRDMDGRFDAIASVGMAEHVGPSHLGEYVGAVWRLLSDGGGFLNHCIVTGHPDRVRTGRERTFANAYVFPDGGLVPAWRIVQEIQQGGFEILDVEQLRPHYALTLRRWIRNLESHHDAAVASASELDYRVWRIYMAGSAVGFETGSMEIVQVLGHKPGPAGTNPPLGRAWMAPAS
ncbi:MAG: class I SAM-dependent methyltransferase [Egibacteraceae bacterium]